MKSNLSYCRSCDDLTWHKIEKGNPSKKGTCNECGKEKDFPATDLTKEKKRIKKEIKES